MKLGNVLPTRESLAISDRYAARLSIDKATAAASLLPGIPAVIEQGESRHYQGPNRYAVISARLRPLWFERRTDGQWYASKA